ncbi:hypothetical protein [Microbulbifer discodermiae]|uniref:hypothetical protein n=1 Tax=Microbulbifer sp. 2201CG32-9 TaxID=3232309 RepID=UPI00345C26E3
MKSTVAGVLIGLITAYLGVILTGYSAAIAIPEAIANFISGRSFLLWEIFVTQLLGYGLSVFVLILAAAKLLNVNPWVTSVVAFITCEFALYPAYTAADTIYILHIIVFAGCALSAAALGRPREAV